MNAVRRVGAWVWGWRFVLAMNLYLISPVLWYELRPFNGGPDKTILFTLPGSLLWLLLAQCLVRRIWIAHAIMFPFYVLVAIDLYLISMYRMRLSSSTILVILENLGDGWGYAQIHWKSFTVGIGSLFLGYALGLWSIRNHRVRLPRYAAPAAGLALGTLYLGVYRVAYNWTFVLAADRNSPFGFFSQSFIAKEVYADSLRHAERAKSFVFGATRPKAPAEPEIYVLVIGESSRPHNWSLYGYERETNPRLSGMKDLVVFQDVVTQSALTQVAVPLLITRGSIINPEPTERERSIVSAYREGGFSTYWISTQQRDPYTGAINRFPREADVEFFFERRHDQVLLDAVADVLKESPDAALDEAVGDERAERGHQKLFFVLHMLGSHFVFESRYPSEFAVFPDGDGAASEKERWLNSYDNSIVYTDHLLAELIGMLRRYGGASALVYCSDHGENLKDDQRELMGHFHNNEYDLPVPMLLWYSKRYEELRPGFVAAARANRARPLTTRSVFYTLAHMAGIDLSDPDLARLSVGSQQLEDVPRMVFGVPEPVNYDQWLTEQGLTDEGLSGFRRVGRTVR